MNEIIIDNRIIGKNNPAFVIAEVGQAHDGSLAIAHSFIDSVFESGADAIKFQTHIAKAESTLDEKFRKRFSTQDTNRFEYWKRMEFTFNQWKELKEHADDKGIVFLSSAFSLEAFDILNELNIAAWKIGSGELNSNLLIQKMVESNKPVLLSTGMSYIDEIDEKVKYLNDKKCDYAIFQCTSQYPTKPENVGINFIPDFINKYNVPIGLSDHTGNIFSSLASISLGANLIEVHVTFNKKMFGPDASSSINFDQLKLLVEGKDEIFKFLSSKKSKDEITNKLIDMRSLFTKSLALKNDMKIGQVISRSSLVLKKPGTGIPIKNINDVIGRELIKDVSANRLLNWNDIKL